METLSGGCQCGGVRYVARGKPGMVALCHCSMCRRANAAPMVAWAMFEADEVEFVEGKPAQFASSPGARRGFCGHCGTQICFTADFLPGLIDITVGSLDAPERLAPELHYWDAERLPWVAIADGLPRHDGTPPVAVDA